jgi:hypothetical protein
MAVKEPEPSHQFRDLKLLMSETQTQLDEFAPGKEKSKVTLSNNLDMFSELDLDSSQVQEDFSQRCRMVNEYNILTGMMNNQDLFEYSSLAHKVVPACFIRCLDFFQDGKTSNSRQYNLRKLQKQCQCV